MDLSPNGGFERGIEGEERGRRRPALGEEAGWGLQVGWGPLAAPNRFLLSQLAAPGATVPHMFSAAPLSVAPHDFLQISQISLHPVALHFVRGSQYATPGKVAPPSSHVSFQHDVCATVAAGAAPYALAPLCVFAAPVSMASQKSHKRN